VQAQALGLLPGDIRAVIKRSFGPVRHEPEGAFDSALVERYLRLKRSGLP